ncbi:MAG: hypothetical protein NT106_10660, partial [Candidatus Sumerlaeota bacterium]|nr:hypothetical protein [Candidatus Sumerlaeota bacterium]
MKHFANPSFWSCYEKLPPSVQNLADKNFELLKTNPKHPSLHLKKVAKYWSARVCIKYRALAVEIDEGLIWFWIGPHSEYNLLL